LTNYTNRTLIKHYYHIMDAFVPGVASIWITKGNYRDDKVYQEYGNYNKNEPLLLHWNGQRCGRDDHLVIGRRHTTHVFYRIAPTGAFKYLGIVDNETITGPHGSYDHDEREPATYQFTVSSCAGVHVVRGTKCVPDGLSEGVGYKWKRAAAGALGLAGGNLGSGIMEHTKPIGKRETANEQLVLKR
jgi:hypothetical protein